MLNFDEMDVQVGYEEVRSTDHYFNESWSDYCDEMDDMYGKPEDNLQDYNGKQVVATIGTHYGSATINTINKG